jgi:predicted PurR-regulated permease PerM
MTLANRPAPVLTLLLVPIAVLDNVLKPLLMGRGLRTPTLVILIGVIGGTITYGLLGLFLGSVVLSVLYELMAAWVRRAPPAAQTPLALDPSIGA